MTERLITADLLLSLGACREQVDVFRREWPDGGAVTLENCLRAAELGLDFDWAADKLLSATAWKAYEEAVAPALEAYNEAVAPAWKAYCEARATAFYKSYVEDKR